MEFANREYFLLLLLIIPYIIWYVMFRKKSEPTIRMADTYAFRYAPRSWKVLLMPVQLVLRLLAFTLLVVALARPQTEVLRIQGLQTFHFRQGLQQFHRIDFIQPRRVDFKYYSIIFDLHRVPCLGLSCRVFRHLQRDFKQIARARFVRSCRRDHIHHFAIYPADLRSERGFRHFRLLLFLRIRQEADCQHDTGKDGDDDQPEGRFLIIQDVLYPTFYSDFAESQRTGCDASARETAVEQRLRIGREALLIHAADDRLVAGRLDIAGKQDEGQPAQRIEPVDGKEQERKRLPDMVPALQMHLFVGKDRSQRFPFHRGRNIDPRAENAENERRIHFVAGIDAASCRHRSGNGPSHFQI